MKTKPELNMPFAWIEPYQTRDDYALAIWNSNEKVYELGDGDCYTPELMQAWNPKWLSWPTVEKAISEHLKKES